MRTFTLTGVSLAALLTFANAVALPQASTAPSSDQYFGSATGYSGSINSDGVCDGDVLGVAVAPDGTQSDCISAPVNCIRASTTAGAGVFSGQCDVLVWSSAGCNGDAESMQQAGQESVFGASNVRSFKMQCQMT